MSSNYALCDTNTLPELRRHCVGLPPPLISSAVADMEPPSSAWEMPLLTKLSGIKDAAAAPEDAAAPEPAQADTSCGDLDAVCKLLWAAAVVNRAPDAPHTTPGLQYLTHLADHEQLMVHLSAAAVRALDYLCSSNSNLSMPTAAAAASAAVSAAAAGLRGRANKPAAGTPPSNDGGAGGSSSSSASMSAVAAKVAAAAAAASSASSAASPFPLELTKAQCLPLLQLLTALAICTRALNNNARRQSDMIATMAAQFLLMVHLTDGGGWLGGCERDNEGRYGIK